MSANPECFRSVTAAIVNTCSKMPHSWQRSARVQAIKSVARLDFNNQINGLRVGSDYWPPSCHEPRWMNEDQGLLVHKILVVDDDQESRELPCEFLEANGYAALAVADASAAHDVLNRDLEYRVVIADLRMPQESGLELLRKLRRQKSKHQIILMSSFISGRGKKSGQASRRSRHAGQALSTYGFIAGGGGARPAKALGNFYLGASGTELWLHPIFKKRSEDGRYSN